MAHVREFGDCIARAVDYPSIQTAFERDHQYAPVYDEYAQTSDVHPLLVDRENLTLMMRLISGGLSHTARDDYSDSHVSISSTSRTLTIKHWLVAHPTLTINLQDIVYILPASSVVPSSGVAAWGLGATGVGWARDARRLGKTTREDEHSYVCKFKHREHVFYAGFTVEKPGSFVQVLEDTWYGD